MPGQDGNILQGCAYIRTAEQGSGPVRLNSFGNHYWTDRLHLHSPMIETPVRGNRPKPAFSVRGSLRRPCRSGHQEQLRTAIQMKILGGGGDDGGRL